MAFLFIHSSILIVRILKGIDANKIISRSDVIAITLIARHLTSSAMMWQHFISFWGFYVTLFGCLLQFKLIMTDGWWIYLAFLCAHRNLNPPMLRSLSRPAIIIVTIRFLFTAGVFWKGIKWCVKARFYYGNLNNLRLIILLL
jgi:hypothetical protein